MTQTLNEILPYKENYFMFEELVNTGSQTINTVEVNDGNIDRYFTGLLNILKDGIERDEVQSVKIQINYADGPSIKLTLFDLFSNMIMWKTWTATGRVIESDSFFFEEALTKPLIKRFLDKTFVDPFRDKLEIIHMNNILDDANYYYGLVDDFGFYLSDTVCAEDTSELMDISPRFRELTRPNFDGVPFEEIKNKGLEYTEERIKIMKENNHCLTDALSAGEAINKKQFKEVDTDIGTKPNGEGGAYPIHINNSFINGGLDRVEYYYVESATGRIAQILEKSNVAISGDFARLLGTNNQDTMLHPDHKYFCDTQHLVKVHINDRLKLSEYNLRYYKNDPMEKNPEVLDGEDTSLIGRTLYFYSPTKCASFARGEGICRRCYGNLYYSIGINPGKLASDLLSSKYTQRLLSAKHLLESAIIAMIWTEEMYNYLQIDLNTITVREDCTEDVFISFTSADINADDDDEEKEYAEYLTSFTIRTATESFVVKTNNLDEIYLSSDMSNYIREFTNYSPSEDDEIYNFDINLKHFNEYTDNTGVLFLLKLKNDELAATLNKAKSIINKTAVTSTYNLDGIIEDFIDVNNNGGIVLNAVHYEVLVSNQIRSSEDILEKPDWSTLIEPKYSILTLSQALTNNPSITICLLYRKVSDTLYKPLSFRKHKSSVFDLYYMKCPQEYISNPNIVTTNQNADKEEVNTIEPFTFDDAKMANFLVDDDEEDLCLDDMDLSAVNLKDEDDEDEE